MVSWAMFKGCPRSASSDPSRERCWPRERRAGRQHEQPRACWPVLAYPGIGPAPLCLLPHSVRGAVAPWRPAEQSLASFIRKHAAAGRG